MLSWLARMRVANATQIGRAFATTARAARKRCAALASLGLLRSERVFFDQPALYLVTAAGCRLAGSTFTAGQDRINLTTLRHSLAVVTVALDLTAAHPGARWLSEHEIRGNRTSRKGGGSEHTPDGVLILPTGGRVAVEVDLSPKEASRLHGIVHFYIRERGFEQVRWFAVPSGMADRLHQIARHVPHITIEAWTVPPEAGGVGET